MKIFGSAVVLCGGKSSRMGFDKSRIRIDDQPIYEQIADQLSLIFDEVILVSGASNPVTSTAYRVVPDDVQECGPIGGILTGLRHCASQYVFFTACDMPFVDLELISQIEEALASQPGKSPYFGAVAVNQGFIEPFFSFYAKNMAQAIEKHIESGHYQISRLVKSLPFLYLEEAFWKREGANAIFSNLNHPQDLEPLKEQYGKRLSTAIKAENNSQAVKTLTIEKWQGGNCQTLEDTVVCEQLLHLYVNGRHYTSMSASPGDACELAAGFLLSQGLLGSREALQSLRFEAPNFVWAMIDQAAVPDMAERLSLTSGCGSGKTRMSLFSQDQIKIVSSQTRFEAQRISAAMRELMAGYQLFKDTGGVHSCALYDREGLVVMREDIGRHNAADKAIGYCFLKGRPMDDLMLLTTGRVSGDILSKAVQAGIPVLASHSAPTDLAVQLAQWAQMTLIGFVRGDRLTVYADNGRINSF